MAIRASVLVPCSGSLSSTRQCVAALARHTQLPWELIAIDDGTTDGMAEYLAGVADTAPFPIQILTNPRPLGVAASWNRAVAVAKGENLVFLQGDAIVTDGWLDQLLALVNSQAAIGLCGPMSNSAESSQRVDSTPYADVASMERFASEWRAQHRGQWFMTDRLSGPCVLIRRPILNAVGGVGEGMEGLCKRARAAGHGMAVAHDLFVHRGLLATKSPAVTKIITLDPSDFTSWFGEIDTARAIHGYTLAKDTHAVLTLLAHADPRRILEIGTAFGHMTANLTEWSHDEARVYSMGIAGEADVKGAAEQNVEIPDTEKFGSFASHFGKGSKITFFRADSLTFDFSQLAPLDFVFVDGGHDVEHVTSDTRNVYDVLAPGGWLVWHDFDSPHAWIRVREAIERLGLAEPVYHVAGTEVAFLRKNGPGPNPLHRTAASSAPVRLMWEGDWRGLHSLGLINREMCRALLSRGVDLGLDAYGPPPTEEQSDRDPRLEERANQPPHGGSPQVFIAHRWPPRLEKPEAGKWIFYQPWEFGSLPKSWLPALQQVDEVWAYSRSVRDCYLDAGVPPERIQIVPLGIDPSVFHPGVEPLSLPARPAFRFLFVGGTIHRKGIDLLLAAFAKAFSPSDDVGLVIQDMGVKSFYRGQTAGTAITKLQERGYAVEYRDTPMVPRELATLYTACDCLVHPYRGDGFALPVVEAMACGTPVIVTGAGPALDYAGQGVAYFVPASRVEFPEDRVGEMETISRPWWWEPDIEALAQQLRHVFENREEAKEKGANASTWIRRHFTWQHAAEAAEARLRVLANQSDRPTASAPMLSPTGPRAKVSLTMIVKNEEHNLPHCLSSAKGLFDEIIVVDTGSTDRTIEIAEEFGARTFDFPWVQDFAAARNAALARATGDYAFWLDADDVIDPPQRERLRAVLDNLRPGDDAAYVVRCACDDGPNGGRTVVDHVRLFPLREEVRWDYAVHEQILPSLRRAGISVRWTDVEVRHTGYADASVRAGKLKRDEAILRQELVSRPGDPFVLFNLGFIAVERQDWQSALRDLTASLKGSAPTDSIVNKLYALIARCHQGLEDAPSAIAACEAGRRVAPDDAELWFREGVVRRQSGDPAGAEACWRRVLTLRRPDKFSSVDSGIYGHLTRRNLASLARERGDLAESAKQWRAVLEECPGDREATSALERIAKGGTSS